MTIKLQDTTITIETRESRLLSSRIISGKLYKLEVPLKSTNSDELVDKCEKLSKLTNDMFKVFSNIKTEDEVRDD